MTDEQKKRSVPIDSAILENDNDETRVWEPDGDCVALEDHQGGDFTRAYRVTSDIDTSGIMSGRHKGFIRLNIEEGADELGKELVEEWRQGRLEVIFIYREFEQEAGIWEDQKTATAWGYIFSSHLHAGSSPISFEVHTMRVLTANKTADTRDYSIDGITAASTIRGGSLGPRTPTPLTPFGIPASNDWANYSTDNALHLNTSTDAG